MKNLVKGLICLSIFFITAKVNAQAPAVREPDMNRPKLFQNLPDKINFQLGDLTNFLEFETGKPISFSFAPGLNFQGVITSTASMPDNSMQSVVIRSTNFQGAALSFSKVKLEDGTILYTGRIISFQHGDAYEISQEKGQYYFVKKGFYDLVNE